MGCWRDKSDFEFVVETKMDARRLVLIRNKCGFQHGLCLSSEGRSGGLGFWWRTNAVNVCSFSNHYIEVEVCDAANIPTWKVVGVYGCPEAINKHLTWDLRRNIRARSTLPLLMW